MVKNSKENVDSNAKNDEKLQKTSRNNSENHANNDSNSLNNNDIAKADNESFKENIKDIITAATVEEKDATATTAINHSCRLRTVATDAPPCAPLAEHGGRTDNQNAMARNRLHAKLLWRTTDAKHPKGSGNLQMPHRAL